MQSAWVRPIKDLCDILLHNERSIQLLRDIDVGTRLVLTAGGSFDELVTKSLTRLHDLVRAEATHFFLLYRAYEDEPLLVHSTAGPHNEYSVNLASLLHGQTWRDTAIIHLTRADIGDAPISPGTQGILISLLPLPDNGL